MNKVVLQFWEESIRGKSPIQDGCSIHLDTQERIKYINSIYDGRNENNIPDEYERTVGDELVAFIEDSLFEKLTKDKSIRIYQHQFKNLLNMSELIIKETI
jgi:hypothetical protein